MSECNTTIAIVDPASSGKKYAPIAKKMGYKTLALMTQKVFPKILKNSLEISDYDDLCFYTTLEDTVNCLQKKKVKALLAGDQTALKTIDVIANQLDVIGNPHQSCQYRVNKALMKQALKSKGIRCANYSFQTDVKKALAWIKTQRYPVVIKPLEGMGSLKVKICHNDQEVMEAVNEINQLDNLFTGIWGGFLIEEFIEGEEYFMNLLSSGHEKRKLISFAQYEKRQIDGYASVYRNIFSLPLEGPMAQKAYEYVNEVNTALEVHYGISDVEFKMTAKGPCFIELNNRLPGANTPTLIQKCSGFDCYRENIKTFLGQKTNNAPITFKKHYCVCCLYNDQGGMVQNIDGLEQIKQLSSFTGVEIFSSKDKYFTKTTDLLSSWGYVYLVHEDPQILRKDADKVHAFMKINTQGASHGN